MWEHMNDYGWGMGGTGPGMGLGMLVLWVLLGLIFAAVVRYATGAGKDEDKSALDILKERYARGEIEREEFEQKKRDLEN